MNMWMWLRFFKKKTILPLLAFVCILYLPGMAIAHTGLDSSSPKDAEVVTAELTKISLVFKSKIESLSTFQLINKENQEIDVLDLQINDTTMVGTLAKPITNGEYQVQWNIVGTDGHPIKGQFSFQVDRPAINNVIAGTSEQTTMKTDTDLKPEAPKVEPSFPATPNEPDNSMLLYILIVLSVLLGITILSPEKKRK
jgi:methionine-rich copper-binding protein CopC